MKPILFTCCLVGVLVSELNLYAQPPKAPSVPATENFFGIEIIDRYRNLENLSDTAVMNWYKAQAAYAEAQLSKLPFRETIYKELKELDRKFSYKIIAGPNLLPAYIGNVIYYVKTMAGEQTGKLYCRPEKGDDILIFDPNKNNNTGKLNLISGFKVNEAGSRIAVVIAQQGNEVGRLFIIDRQQSKIIDSVERVWDPPSWIDNQSFFYSQFPTVDVTSKGFLSNVEAKKHVTGKDVSSDILILSHKKNFDLVPDSADFPFITMPYENSQYILAHIAGSEQFNDVYLARISKGTSELKWYPFIKKEDQIIFYEIQGNKAFGLSVKDNKKGRILSTSAANPDWSKSRIIADATQGIISRLFPPAVTKDNLYYVESSGLEQNLYRIRLDDFRKEEIKLPMAETVVPVSSSPVKSVVKIFVTSRIHPSVIYDFDEKKNSVIEPGLGLTPKVKGLDNIETALVYVPSHDGVKVPLTIIKPKGIKTDGNHPLILYGYGNYGFVEPAVFDPTLSILANHGIIKAIAHVRGGGELGEEWRLGGFKSTKPNTWKDAIACAEWLVKEGYTQPSKMAVMGASAGGILAGRAMTDRPDLFAVAIPQVGVMNTLRFEFTPNGPNHIPEFGTVKDKNDFNNLFEMDSYIHIRDGVKYPATLVTAGLNDPRVILWQPGKFVARLQEANTSGKPVWFRIDLEGGHGFILSKDQDMRTKADIIAFILSQTSDKTAKPF
ncbi:MAG TPA: prolyl oligopeptidase family serine peptidase [Chitinophagaceae bacterium]|nr:prolyl oligopeptidase family serine peptidase [Chitinophagaceae bacterium]